MFHLPSQGLKSNLNPNNNVGLKLLQQPSAVNVMQGGDSILSSSRSKARNKSTAASKIHKEAERRRRQRINSHLSTFRSILPNITKANKASVLGEVVRHVKELREKAADVAYQFPGEVDEATLSYIMEGRRCGGDARRRMIKVSVCCEDRPGLNLDLDRAIGLVPVEAVRAEMMTVGGRTRISVVLKWRGRVEEEEEDVMVLKRALKAVVENRVGEDLVVQTSKPVRVSGLVPDDETSMGDDYKSKASFDFE